MEDGRVTVGALWTPANTIQTKTGFRPGSGTSPGSVGASGSPNANVHVAPFMLVLQSTRGGTGGGVYVCGTDLSVAINVLATPAHASLSRRDLIIAQQNDAFYGDADSIFTIKAVVGTPSGSPVDPTVTGSPDYVTLARVTVGPNVTTITNANITDLRPAALYTVACGGVLPVASQAVRDALAGIYAGMPVWRSDRNWTEVYTGSAWRVQGVAYGSSQADITSAVTSPYDGQLAVDTTGVAYLYNGSAWVEQFPRMASGTVNVTINSAASFGGPVAVSFPASRFTATPRIVMTQSALPGGTAKWVGKQTGGSTSGFNAYAYTGDGANNGSTVQTSFDWIAVQAP